jgi:hypothetical protein
VQTCSRCQTQSLNSVFICPGCGSDLREFSTTAVTLKRYRDNPRVVAIQLATSREACPACQAAAGTYPKDKVPTLPVEGCSNLIGCHCFYQPLLDEIFP